MRDKNETDLNCVEYALTVVSKIETLEPRR
jgi:hypothetical protein